MLQNIFQHFFIALAVLAGMAGLWFVIVVGKQRKKIGINHLVGLAEIMFVVFIGSATLAYYLKPSNPLAPPSYPSLAATPTFSPTSPSSPMWARGSPTIAHVTPMSTGTPTDTQLPKLSVASAKVPTHTPQVTQTRLPKPIIPTVTAVARTQATNALTIRTIRSDLAGPNMGTMRVAFDGPGGPMVNQDVQVMTVKKDVLGMTVPGDQVTDGQTDNTGIVMFTLQPANYVVLSVLKGHNWGNLSHDIGQGDVRIGAGYLTTLHIRIGRLIVTASTVDQATNGQSFRVLFPKRDIKGNFVGGDPVIDGSTDNTGEVSFDLVPGHYEVASDFPGYNWGNMIDTNGIGSLVVQSGKDTVVNVRLGRVIVEAYNQTGGAAVSVPVELHREHKDTKGHLVVDDSIADGNTDNGGTWSTDVTAGTYALLVNSNNVGNIEVKSGKVATKISTIMQ